MYGNNIGLVLPVLPHRCPTILRTKNKIDEASFGRTFTFDERFRLAFNRYVSNPNRSEGIASECASLVCDNGRGIAVHLFEKSLPGGCRSCDTEVHSVPTLYAIARSIWMEKWALGVFASIDAGLGVRLEVARELGVTTVHLHAPQPNSRTPERARSFSRLVSENGITITCVFAGFEGESYADIPTVQQTVGLVPSATRSERLAELKEIADFARLLNVNAVGLHVGFVPHDKDHPEYGAILAAMREICDHCLGLGQAVHLETGQEPADVLLQFLRDVERENFVHQFRSGEHDSLRRG